MLNKEKFRDNLDVFYWVNLITQKEFAENVWVSEATIINIKNRWFATATTLKKLSKYIDIDILNKK
jgi:DNA-binding XRE family transcriptional regulator